jgi:hypothetical protein
VVRGKPLDFAEEMTRLWTMIDGQQEQINAIEAKLVQLLAHMHSHPPDSRAAHFTHDVEGRRLPAPVPRLRHPSGNGDVKR